MPHGRRVEVGREAGREAVGWAARTEGGRAHAYVPRVPQTHGFKERKNYSTTGEVGMGDSWGALAVPYLLAKYVFPRMEHVGWTGLHEAALLEKSRPYSL